MKSGERHFLYALDSLMHESRVLIVDQGERALRPSHYRVIGHVPPEGITVTDLSDRVGMTKQGIGQFVSQLTESGHLTVLRDPEDLRVRVVRRTPEGDAAARRLAELLEQLEARWAERVGTRRYRQFRAVLDEIAGLR